MVELADILQEKIMTEVLQRGRPPGGVRPPPRPQGGPLPSPTPDLDIMGITLEEYNKAIGQGGLAGLPLKEEGIGSATVVADALEVLHERGQKGKGSTDVMIALQESATDRGMELPPTMSPDSGGLATFAARGGPVLYRREGGRGVGEFDTDEGSLTEAERQRLLTELSSIIDDYGWDRRSFLPGEKIGLINNPMFDVQQWATGTGGTGDYDVIMKRDPSSPFGAAKYGMSEGVERYNRILDQLAQETEDDKPPSDFVPLDQGIQAGSIWDPNLPSIDAAQMRQQYRENVGFFDKPSGPSENVATLLTQAYGDSPMRDRILAGLAPELEPMTALEAYYSRPDIMAAVGAKPPSEWPEEPDPRLPPIDGRPPPIGIDPIRPLPIEDVIGRDPLRPLPIEGSPRPVERSNVGTQIQLMNERLRQAGAVPAQTGTQGQTIGEFSGRVPGDGGGMQDNIRMPIKEGNKQIATLAVSPTEYVVDSHTMAALGNGNPDKGADYMDEVVKGIRKQAYGTDKQPREINGLASLRAMMG